MEKKAKAEAYLTTEKKPIVATPVADVKIATTWEERSKIWKEKR